METLAPHDVPRRRVERRLDLAAGTPATQLRALDDDGGPGVLYGHFAVFNTLTTIRSRWEGNFREQIRPGAFTKTFAERRREIRCIYEHGFDPMFGTKPLGVPEELLEDAVGAYYGVPLFDNQLNRDHVAVPAAAGQLSASFAFDVLGEEWDENPADQGLPIRTITEARVYEFGPCPFAAYSDATAGMRSVAASWHDLSPARRAQLAEALNVSSTSDLSAGPATEITPEAAHIPPAPEPNHAARTISTTRQTQILATLGIS